MSRRVITRKEAEALSSAQNDINRQADAIPPGQTVSTAAAEKIENTPDEKAGGSSGTDAAALQAAASRVIVLTKDSELTLKAAGPTSVKEDTYLDRLIKYIPAEIIAAYVFISGILSTSSSDIIVNWISFGVLLVLTPLYIWRLIALEDKKANNPQSRKPAWAQMIIAFFAFAIWVYAIGGPFASLPWYNRMYGSVLVALYTVIVPVIRQ